LEDWEDEFSGCEVDVWIGPVVGEDLESISRRQDETWYQIKNNARREMREEKSRSGKRFEQNNLRGEK
jgi:hypothetical protein